MQKPPPTKVRKGLKYDYKKITFRVLSTIDLWIAYPSESLCRYIFHLNKMDYPHMIVSC